MKLNKRRKSSRFRGTHTHGRGFKKKARGSGHQGGKGMAGTGKRADQKKTLILNLPYEYFGKDRTLRAGKKPKKLEVQDLRGIESKLDLMVKKGIAKESKGIFEINLKGYKILGNQAKHKMHITASAATASAIEAVEKAGGKILLGEKKAEVKQEKKAERKEEKK